MADVTYGVSVEYLSSGALSLPTTGLDKATASFKGLESVAHGFNSVLDGILSTIGSVASAAATGFAAVAAAGLSLATHEAVKFNQEMEDTQTGLATIANAQSGLNGFTDPKEAFGNQYRLAGDVIKEMRRDAQELPGEFKDLQNMMALMAPAATNAGIGMFDTEKIAAHSMAAAAALRVPFTIAGREVGNIIAGTVTNRMPMFSKMGLGEAKDWNKLSQADRVTKFRQKLSDMAPGLDSVQKNWSTISSNFVDNLKIGVGLMGGPLLDRVKTALDVFNKSDKGGLANIGDRIGRDLVKAFDRGQIAIKHWFPIIQTFIQTMSSGFQRVFDGMEPIVTRLLGRLESFMKDPAAFNKLEHILGTLVALRVGGAALSAGASAAPGLLTAAGSMGMGGAALGAAALPIVAVLAAAALAVEGFMHALMDSTSLFHGAAQSVAKDTATSWGKLVKSLEDLWATATPLVDLFGVIVAALVGLEVALVSFQASILAKLYGGIGSAVGYVYHGLFNAPLANDDAATQAMGDKRTADAITAMDKNLNPIKYMGGNGQEGNVVPKPPTHTTHIHKVEIKVMSNQDPGRIAHKVVGLLKEEARNPRSAAINPAAAFNRSQ